MPVNNQKKSNRKKHNISVIDYDLEHLDDFKTHNLKELIPYKNTNTVTWINIDEVPPLNYVKDLELGFDLHPVVLEDIMNANQRPKIEILDQYIYLVFKMLSLTKNRNLAVEQVSMVIAPKFVITFQQGIEGDSFNAVRKKLQNSQSRIRGLTSDHLAYELIQAAVNNYFVVLENISETINYLENKLINNPGNKTLRKIHHTKSQIINMKKFVWPLKEVVNSLLRGDSPLIKKNARIYIRDIYDRLVQVLDTIESYLDILEDQEDLYMSSASHKLNSTMKILTVITTVFMPLSFLAGLYGMNFRYMPGLDSPFGFTAMIFLMLVIFVLMIFYFKKKEWI